MCQVPRCANVCLGVLGSAMETQGITSSKRVEMNE